MSKFIVFFLSLVSIYTLSADGVAPSGAGTEQSPYLISSLDNLLWLSTTTSVWNDGAYFEQTADIDASDTQTWNGGAGFSPIGTDETNKFVGNVDGGNFTISNLYIYLPSNEDVGLFGYADSSRFENITIEDSEVHGDDRSAILIGRVNKYSEIDNCHIINSSVDGEGGCGLLCGYAWHHCEIRSSSASGTVSVTQNAGGCIGYVNYECLVEDSYSSANVIATGGYAGGFIKSNNLSIVRECYSTGDVQGTSYIGGFASSGYESIINCFCSGSVTSTGEYSGGFAGAVFGSVYNCYTVSELSGNTYDGGFVGYYNGTLFSNCIWSNTLSDPGTAVGREISGSYNNLEESNHDEMRLESTFTSLGWDFLGETGNGTNEYWHTNPNVNDGFPFLYHGEVFADFSADITVTEAGIDIHFSDESVPQDSVSSWEWDFDGDGSVDSYIQNPIWSYSSTGVFSPALRINGDHENEFCYIEKTGYIVIIDPADGTGTENDPFLISSLGNLLWLSYTQSVWDDGAYFKQTSNIDATPTYNIDNHRGFVPIGNNSVQFNGTFNGNDYTIANLFVDKPAQIYIGLFGRTLNAYIENVNLTSASMTGDRWVGALAGLSQTTDIANCFSSGLIQGNDTFGGLMGKIDGSIVSSSSECDVEGGRVAGGLAGSITLATVSDCYAEGHVHATGDYSGGLIGSNNYSTVQRCYSLGHVTGSDKVGGFIGSDYCTLYSPSSITNCVWNTETSGMSTGIGVTDSEGTYSVNGKTSTQMREKSTYTSISWDFVGETANGSADIWDIGPGSNDGYPFFYDPIIIEEDTIWSGPVFTVDADVTIADGVTLTIDPGTVVKFQGHHTLNVQGCLLAVGTEAERISFTIADTTGFSDPETEAGGWGGIRFDNTPVTNDSSKIAYCDIEYGKATDGEHPAICGGAIYVNAFDKIVIDHCNIQNNIAGDDGGAVYCFDSRLSVSCSHFENNYASTDGGALRFLQSNAIINACCFTNNEAEDDGGAIDFYQCDSSRVENCDFTDNETYSTGGAINSYQSSPDVIGCLFASNSAQSEGGGAIMIMGLNSNAKLINCTIISNYGYLGGGILFDCNEGSEPELINNIIYDNTSFDGDQLFLYTQYSDPDIFFCNIEDGQEEFGLNGNVTYDGTYQNNIDVDPGFVGTGDHPYQLGDMSYCADAGHPDLSGLDIPDTDLAGNPRIHNNRIDIGAYEYQGDQFQPDFVWAKSGGFLGTYGVDVDKDGNVYVVGSYVGAIEYSPGLYTEEYGTSDIYVAKLDRDGNWQWVFTAGGVNADEGSDICIGSDGSIYVTGSCNGNVTFGSQTITSTGNNLFILKLESSGEVCWVEPIACGATHSFRNICVDIEDNLYIAGAFTSTIDLGSTYSANGSSCDLYIAKYTNERSWDWVITAGSNNQNDLLLDMEIDKSGFLYATGSYRGNFSLEGHYLSHVSETDVFAVKLSSGGVVEYVTTGTGASNDSGFCITVDDDNNAYIGGNFRSNLTFDGVTNLNSVEADDYDMFIAKLDANGNKVWANSVSSLGSSDGFRDLLLLDNQLKVLGNVEGTALFGETSITSNGESDCFIASMDLQGIFQNVRTFGGTGNDLSYGISSNPVGDLALTGIFSDSIWIGNTQLVAEENYDGFVTQFGYNDPIPAFEASYAADNLTPVAGDVIQFTDTSTGNHTEWYWDFGDGNTSTEQHPTHAFATPGTYEVKMTITKWPFRDRYTTTFTEGDNPESGMIAYYPFTAGSVADSSGCGNDGVNQGAVPAPDRFGIENNCYSFNGDDDYITTSFTPLIYADSAFTMSVWVKVDPYTNSEYYDTILGFESSGSNSFNLRYDAYSWDLFDVYYRDDNHANDVVSIMEHADGVWHHFVVEKTVDGYLNTWEGGVLRYSTELSATGDLNIVTSKSVYLGCSNHNNVASYDFDGYIDDFRFYNRALSASEIQALYHEGGWDDLDQGLVAYYPFNGNASDESWNGNDGDVHTGTSNQPELFFDRFGNPASAYGFDGVDDYIDMGFAPQSWHEITLCGWVNRAVYGNSPIIGEGGQDSGDNDLYLRIFDSNLQFRVRTPGDSKVLQDPNPFIDDQWEFVAATWKISDQLKLYTNGQSVGSMSAQSDTNDYDYSLYIGALHAGTEELASVFNGVIDDIRIYNRVLTEDEIQTLYNEGGWEQLNANFAARDTIVPLGEDVEFFNCSSGQPTGWLWDFGDGNTSTDQNPIHSYEEYGTYDVTLTITKDADQSLITKTGYIHVQDNVNYGMMAYYPFDGDATDASGNWNNGQISGSVVADSNRFEIENESLYLTGSSSRIALNPELVKFQYDEDFSLSVWLKDGGASASDWVITAATDGHGGELNGWALEVNEDHIRWWLSQSANDMLNNYIYEETGLWFHCVLVYDATTHQTGMYHNNVYYPGETLNNTPIYTGEDYCSIGSYFDDGTHQFFWTGNVDNLRIYDRVLSSTEIDSLYHQGGWPPAINAEISVTPDVRRVAVGENLQFNVVSDDSESIVSWEWDFETDGQIDATVQSPQHAFTQSDSYQVSLTVISQYGYHQTVFLDEPIVVVEDIYSQDFDLGGSIPGDWSTSTRADWVPIQEDGDDYAVGVQLGMFDAGTWVLTSPLIDCSAHEGLALIYDNTYTDAPELDSSLQGGFVEYCIDGGDWTEVRHYNAETTQGTEILDLTGTEGTSVQVRFTYTKPMFSNADVWKIDNFKINGTSFDTTPPDPPTNVVAEHVGGQEIVLSWTPVIESRFDKYEVEYGLLDQDFSNLWSTVNDPLLTDRTTNSTVITGLLDYSIYQFRMKAWDQAGNVSDTYSNTAVDTVNAEYVPPVISNPVPEQPSEWHNDYTVTIGCSITDSGVGVDPSTIQYRFDFNGNGTYDELPEEQWTDYQASRRQSVSPVISDAGSTKRKSDLHKNQTLSALSDETNSSTLRNTIFCETDVTSSNTVSEGVMISFEWRSKDEWGNGYANSGTTSLEGIIDDWQVKIDAAPPQGTITIGGYAPSTTSVMIGSPNTLSDPYFETYQVFYSHFDNVDETCNLWDSSNDANLANAAQQPVTTVTGLTPNRNYYFALRGIDEAGNANAFSNVLYIPTGGESSPPDAPENVMATDNTNYIELSWDMSPQADVTQYNIYRGTVSGSLSLLTTVDVSGRAITPQHQYQDTQIIFGTTYYYQVSAVTSESQEGALSSEIEVEHSHPGELYANFSANVTEITLGDTIHFTDQSGGGVGTIISWEWDFDNNGTIDDTNQHPHFVYPETGLYSVRLTVTDDAERSDTILSRVTTTPQATSENRLRFPSSQRSSVTEVKEDYITVNPEIPVLAIDPDSLDFGDETTELTYTISNSGTGQLYWAADESEDWMSIAETSVRFVAASRVMRNSIGGSVASGDSSQVLVSIDRTDLIEGDYDGTISVTSNGGTQDINVHMEVVGNAPDAPTNLLAYPADSEVSLTWDSNTEADLDAYRLYRDTTPNPTTLVAVIDANLRSVTYLDTLLTNGVTYHYHVTAVDVLGNESDPSNEVTATPVEIPTYWFVSTTGTDGPDYGSQTEPFATIQYAIDTAVSGDTIQVADGVYHENINFDGKDLLLTSEYFVDEDTSHIFNTIIDGGGNNRVVTFVNGESSQAILNGLTLRNGNASYGGGIYCQNASPMLSHLRVVGNYANYGGGIALIESDCQMIRLEVTGNQALHKGGGLYLDGSNPTIVNCTIASNMCVSGGGIYAKECSNITIINSIIFGNDQMQISFGSSGNISHISIAYSLLDENDINTGSNYGYITSDNMLETYPLFRAAKYPKFGGTPFTDGSYQLHSISDCRNAGAPNSQYNDPDLSRNDMGVYFYDERTPDNEFQSTLFVAEDGSDISGDGSIEDPYATVQYAVDQLQTTATDTIIVLPGTYVENIQILNSVVLGSLYMIDPWEGFIDSTIIDGGSPSNMQQASAFGILNPATRTFDTIDVSILGLSIMNGLGWTINQIIVLPDIGEQIVERIVGGGIYVKDCTPLINANKFLHNGLSGTHEGGAVYTNIDDDAEDRRTRTIDLDYRNNWFIENYAQVGNSVSNSDFDGSIDLSGSEFDVAATLNRDECGVSSYWCAKDSLISYSFDNCTGRQEAYVNTLSIDPDTLGIVISKVYGDQTGPVTINLSAGQYTPGRTLRNGFPLQIPDHVSIVGSGTEDTEINPLSTEAAFILDHSDNVTISSLSITGGSSEIGGGLYVNDSELMLQDVDISGNQANIGGALFMKGSATTLSGVTLDGNQALEGAAGAIYVENSMLDIADATIRNSVTSYISQNEDAFGSGIYVYNSDITIQNLVLENNILPGENSKGAGIYLFNSEGVETDVLIENVEICNNSANYGCGIYMVRVNPVIRNVLIADNNAFMQGGAIYAKDCFPHIVNCTIVNNSSGGTGGLYLTGQGDTFPGIEIINTILWGNEDDQVRLFGDPKLLTISYCDVMNGEDGINKRPQDTLIYTDNIELDPLLNIDYTLSGGSPCISAGNPDPQYNDPDGSRNDIGAFYFTGLGVPANLVISVAESTLTITWLPVDSASSYKVYSCGTPDGNFTVDTSGTINGTSWTAPMPRGDRYYYVKAVLEGR